MATDKTNVVVLKPIRNLLQSKRGETFRQTRLENNFPHQAESLRLNIGGQEYRLLNWSRTGMAFVISGANPPPFTVGLTISPVAISLGEIPVYSGSILIKSVRRSADEELQIGSEFKTSLFLVDGIEAAAKVNNLLNSLTSNHTEVALIHPEVCKVIVEMSSALRMTKQLCDEQERKLLNLTLDSRNEVLKIFMPSLASGLEKILNELSRRIESYIDVVSLPEDSPYHRLFEELIYPFFTSSDLARRAVEKPMGYSGDFEIMNQFYRNGFEGTDLFGKVLHHYATSSDSAEPVKFRKPYFCSQIERTLDGEGEKKILSLASGPAVEIQDLISRWSQSKIDRANFALLDLDKAALEHAQTKIYEICLAEGKTAKVEYYHGSVKLILSSREVLKEPYDLIYSAGLFDYIDNTTAQSLVRAFSKRLKSGGRLIIGNYTRNHTTKAFVHLITKWTLNHKTEGEIRNWVEGLDGFVYTLEYDDKRVQAFLVLEKK